MFISGEIAFIGGGSMATALITGLIDRGWPPTQIRVVEPSADQRRRLGERFDVRTMLAADASLRAADIAASGSKGCTKSRSGVGKMAELSADLPDIGRLIDSRSIALPGV